MPHTTQFMFQTRKVTTVQRCTCDASDFSPNFTWLDSTRLDTFDVSSPCILAVSS